MIVELHWSKVWSIHDLQSYCNNSIIHVHACPLQQTWNIPGPQPVATCSCEELHDHQSDESRPEIQPLQRGGHDGHDPAKSEALCARQSGAWWSAWTSRLGAGRCWPIVQQKIQCANSLCQEWGEVSELLTCHPLASCIQKCSPVKGTGNTSYSVNLCQEASQIKLMLVYHQESTFWDPSLWQKSVQWV